MEPTNLTDAELAAYKAGRKERKLFEERMGNPLPNEPVSTDLLFALGPDGIPYYPGMGDAFFSAEPELINDRGELTAVPDRVATKAEQVAMLNMMTARSRGVHDHLAPVAEGMPKAGEDMVRLPAHYARYKIEPIRFICENKLDWFQGNIVKYSLRWDAKNGIQDIDKVARYVEMYKLFILGDPDWWQAGKPEDFKV